MMTASPEVKVNGRMLEDLGVLLDRNKVSPLLQLFTLSYSSIKDLVSSAEMRQLRNVLYLA